MTDHEKRIREALEAGEAEDLLFADARTKDLRALLADLDGMRGLLLGLRQQDYLNDTYRARIDAALTAAKAGGWVAVPVEPTPEMQSAALPYVMRQHKTRAIYAAMLAARPLPNPPKEQ